MTGDDSGDTRSRSARTAARASGAAEASASPAGFVSPVVLVRPATAADEYPARALAERLGTTLLGPDDHASSAERTGTHWTLCVDGGRRTLRRPDGACLDVDFTSGRTAARQHERGLARQPLARAVGVTRLGRRLGRAPRVVDATGGLGRDAWFIASLGCPVTLIERSPLVHALLEAALARAAREPATAGTAARIALVLGDARTLLAELDRSRADVVYLDPMYPESRRRAAVNKGMQFLQALVGGEADESGLLAAALDAAGSQVTVKRPAAAPPLAGDEQFTGQRSTISSPGTRYDVYLVG